MSESPSTLAEKVWDRHVVRSADGEPDLLYIDMHLVHEVTSPQAFDGLRMNDRGVRRPELTVATEDHNVPTADIDQPIADPVSRAQIEHLRVEHGRVQGGQPPHGFARSGHRPRGRARAGTHPPRDDHRVRRQSHRDPRRLRGARLRHRHLRGRARARHPDASPGATEDPERDRRRRAAARRHPQGRHPRHSRGSGHRRRHRPRRRVPGQGVPRHVDGGSDDRLQHVDRGGRQGGPDRTRRDDDRVPAGPGARTERRACGTRPSPTGRRW